MAEAEERSAGTECSKDASDSNMKESDKLESFINISRFDYSAPSSLLKHSRSGFLVTCPIKREKSATKEAISILQQFTGSDHMQHAQGNNKRMKTLNTLYTDVNKDGGFALSLLKLSKNGLVLILFQPESLHDTIDLLSCVFTSLERGSLKPPLWCHRLLPIQATCSLEEKEIYLAVHKLVLHFVTEKQRHLPMPLKFAISYNRMGLEEMSTSLGNDSEACALLDKATCYNTIAAAVQDAIADSAVNLTSPDMIIVLELLPLRGVPSGSIVAAISVLPRDLVTVKPRLVVKPVGQKVGPIKS